jgi:hypothetical protein
MRLGLLPPAQRPTLDEARTAPFRKADVDDIEVPRHDRLREDGACLADDLGTEVTVREMREDKHLDAGRVRKLGGTERRRVQGLVGPLLLFRCERGLVNEHVGVASSLEHLARGTRVTGERELASVTGRTENHVGATGASFRQGHGPAALEPAEERPHGDAQ